jgi:hypothetical protein
VRDDPKDERAREHDSQEQIDPLDCPGFLHVVRKNMMLFSRIIGVFVVRARQHHLTLLNSHCPLQVGDQSWLIIPVITNDHGVGFGVHLICYCGQSGALVSERLLGLSRDRS